jgi:hypothetical protein
MSLLHQESLEEIDDAARGEEFTKGTSHVVWAGVVAAVLVTIAVAVYVMPGKSRPWPAERSSRCGLIRSTRRDLGARRQRRNHGQGELRPGAGLCPRQAAQPEQGAALLEDMLANVKLDDGIHSVSAGDASQYERVFARLSRDARARTARRSRRTPPSTRPDRGGDRLLGFPHDKQQWDARKDLNFTFAFQYQPSLVLAPHTAVIEQ